MNRHGLNKISGKALWTGNLLINSKDKVKTLVSLNTQNARIRLVFPDQSIPKHECERIVRTLGLEIFRGLSACGIKTQGVVQRTGEINVIGIPCG